MILASARGLGIDWAEIWEIPADLWRYAGLLFSDPNWDRLPTATFEMWRSVSMAWLGAILCVVLSIPLGIALALRHRNPTGVVSSSPCADPVAPVNYVNHKRFPTAAPFRWCERMARMYR